MIFLFYNKSMSLRDSNRIICVFLLLDRLLEVYHFLILILIFISSLLTTITSRLQITN